MSQTYLLNVQLSQGQDFGPDGVSPYSSVGNLARNASKAFLAQGAQSIDATLLNGLVPIVGPAYPAAAILYANGTSGTVTATINGVAISVAAGVDDVATSNAFVAAINASTDPMIKGQVGASNVLTNQVHCVGVQVGDSLSIGGQTFVAVALGAPERNGEFALGASDVATATSLLGAIKRSSVLWIDYVILQTANFFVVVQKQPGAALASSALISSAPTRIVVDALAPSVLFAVWSILPSWLGNHVTVAASGTGMSVFLDSSGRMFGGSGLSGVPISQFGGSP